MELDQQEEQPERMLPTLPRITPGQVLLSGGALLTTGLVDAAIHFGDGTVVFVGLLVAGAIAGNSRHILDFSDEVLDMLIPGRNADAAIETTTRILEATAPEERVYGELDQSPKAKLKRLFSLSPPENQYVIARPKEARAEEDEQKTIKLPPRPEEWDESWYNDDDDDLAGPTIGTSGLFTFSDLLATGFVPSLSAICLGRLADGTLITVAAKDLCHVALPGATGHGKSSLIRLIMAQLCCVGLPVYLLNPHYMVFDREHNEDWTPFTPYLKADPFVCKDTKNIARVLDWMTGTLLPARKERAAKGGKIGKPYFFVLDEVPDIVKAIPGASEKIGKILREGRKYGIYLIVASQDFSVKTLGVEGEGSVRRCFLTVCYVGGDPISVRELLNLKVGTNVKGQQIVVDENALGQGPIIVKCAMTQDPVHAQTPYVDNESLYLLLGPSTFIPEDDETLPDDEEDVYAAINENGQSSSFPAISQSGPTRKLGNDDGNDMEMAQEAGSGNVISGVFPLPGKEMPKISRSDLPLSDDKLEMIRQMKEHNYQDNEIVALVKLQGRKYQVYKQCLMYLGYKLAKEG